MRSLTGPKGGGQHGGHGELAALRPPWWPPSGPEWRPAAGASASALPTTGTSVVSDISAMNMKNRPDKRQRLAKEGLDAELDPLDACACRNNVEFHSMYVGRVGLDAATYRGSMARRRSRDKFNRRRP
jgi:hypothetical protein